MQLLDFTGAGGAALSRRTCHFGFRSRHPSTTCEKLARPLPRPQQYRTERIGD